MSSNLPLAVTASKTSNSSGQLSPGQAQPTSAVTGDTYGQRRSGGSGSFGAGAATRGTAAPRNNQSSRKQNKSSKRIRSADEDAIAESVCLPPSPAACDTANTMYLPSIGRYAVYKQSQGANLHYPLDELLASSETAEPTPTQLCSWPQQPEKSDMGVGFWISRR